MSGFIRIATGSFGAGLWIGGVCVLLGCQGVEYTPIQHYALYANVDAPDVAASDETLGVRPLDYARFYKQKMVYRDSAFGIEYYDLHQWAELPRDAITRMLLDGLIDSGHFDDVGYAHDLVRPDLILTGELRRLDQVRSTEPWTAVCEIRFELRERSTGRVRRADTLSAEVPLETHDPRGFAAAMNEAAARVVEQAVRRIVTNERDS